jgi:hypothetical protein
LVATAPSSASPSAASEPDAEPQLGSRAADATEVDPGPASTTPSWSGRVMVAAFVAAVVPLVVAAIRAIDQGWVPVGDSAVIAIRTREVLGGDTPMLGMWSSLSWATGFDFNHPGPLLFDLLAVPTELGGDSYAGFIVGNTIINVLSLVGIAMVARRRGGPLLATAALATAATMCWSMGSDVLVEPWHAHSVLLPFLCFLLLVWSITRGDGVCLPWAVGIGSLLVQTNLSYAVMVPALLAWALAGLVLERRRADRSAPASDGSGDGDGVGEADGVPSAAEAEPARPRRRALLSNRVLAVTAVVVAISWARPLIEQFSGDGQGNLSLLVRNLGESVDTVPPGTALRMVADVVTLPPFWFRPSFDDAFVLSTLGNPLPSLAVAALSFLLLVVVLVGCAGDARRRGDRESFAALSIAGVLLVLSLFSADRLPGGGLGVAPYQVRWLWPVGAFVTFAVVGSLARRWSSLERTGRGVVVFGLLTLVVAIANLPASNQGTTALAVSLPVTKDVLSQIDDAELPAAPLIECWERVQYPYCEAIMADLQRRGVDYVQTGESTDRQYGDDRMFDGTNADSTLLILTGEGADVDRPGSRRLALHRGIDEEERLELFYLVQRLRVFVADDLRLNDRGRVARDRGNLSGLVGEVDVDEVFSSRQLIWMVRDDLLDVDGRDAEDLERYADLQERLDDETVAVYVTDEVSPPEAD